MIGEERPFLLYNCLHSKSFQAVSHSLSRKGGVGDGGEGFGNIHSCISFASTDEVNCMTNIGVRELGRMASRMGWKVRTMF